MRADKHIDSLEACIKRYEKRMHDCRAENAELRAALKKAARFISDVGREWVREGEFDTFKEYQNLSEELLAKAEGRDGG